MSKNKRCPACRSSVPVDLEDCPNCPHSFRGEADGVQRRRHGSGSIKPYAFLAAAGAALYFGWQAVALIMSHAENQTQPEIIERMQSIDPDFSAGKGVVPARRAYSTSRGDQSPAEPADSEPVYLGKRSSPPPAERPREWRWSGTVYDLVTLQPVPKATLVFSDEHRNRRFETMADSAGRYRVDVPPLPRRGYSLVIRKPGYALSYAKGHNGAMAKKSEKARRQLARQLIRALDGPMTLTASGASRADFYLAPLRD